jgi:hypothetical protein
MSHRAEDGPAIGRVRRRGSLAAAQAAKEALCAEERDLGQVAAEAAQLAEALEAEIGEPDPVDEAVRQGELNPEAKVIAQTQLLEEALDSAGDLSWWRNTNNMRSCHSRRSIRRDSMRSASSYRSAAQSGGRCGFTGCRISPERRRFGGQTSRQ